MRYYILTVDGKRIGRTRKTSGTMRALTPATSYTFGVIASDGRNRSGTATVEATTAAVIGVPPSDPVDPVDPVPVDPVPVDPVDPVPVDPVPPSNPFEPVDPADPAPEVDPEPVPEPEPDVGGADPDPAPTEPTHAPDGTPYCD